MKLRLVAPATRCGAYNPKTCTRSNAGPALPSAYPICHVSRAGRSSGAAEPKSLIDKLELSAQNFFKSGLIALSTSGPHPHDSHARGSMSLPSSMPGALSVATGSRVGQLQREEGLLGVHCGGSSSCSSSRGGGSSPGTAGSGDSLHFRGARQSTSNAGHVGVVTGFPGERNFAAEHC